MSTKLTDVELQGGSTVDMSLPSSDNSTAIPNTAWVKALLSGFAPGSGTVTLPGGLIIKWGTTPNFDTGPTTITFGVAFPTACLNVQLTGDNDPGVSSRIWQAGALSTSSFVARNDGTGTAFWLAIGH